MTEVPASSPSIEERTKAILAEQSTASGEPTEKIVVKDKDVVRDRMIAGTTEALDRYLAIPNKPRSGKRKKLKKIGKVSLDNTIPLDMIISKGYLYTKQGECRCPYLYIEIKDGTSAIVAEFGLRDYGDEFRLSHRKVSEKYRGKENAIADSALLAIEGFVKKYAQKTGRQPVINANAAQLEVIRWFSKNGFQTTREEIPVHGDEAEMTVRELDDVLTSLEKKDEKFVMGPYGYVFPGNFEGPQILEEGSPEGVNIDRAATIHLKKELVPTPNPEVERQTGIRDLITRARSFFE